MEVALGEPSGRAADARVAGEAFHVGQRDALVAQRRRGVHRFDIELKARRHEQFQLGEMPSLHGFGPDDADAAFVHGG